MFTAYDIPMTFNNRDFGNRRRGEFVCGTYKRKGKEHCATHYITYDNVCQKLLQEIRDRACAAQKDEQQFLRLLERENKQLIDRKIASILPDESQARVRAEQLDQIISKLYEDRALNVISIDRFQLLFVKYSEEQKDIKEKLDKAAALRQCLSEQAELNWRFLWAIKESADANEITPPLLGKLVRRISVEQTSKYEKQKINVEFAVG